MVDLNRTLDVANLRKSAAALLVATIAIVVDIDAGRVPEVMDVMGTVVVMVGLVFLGRAADLGRRGPALWGLAAASLAGAALAMVGFDTWAGVLEWSEIIGAIVVAQAYAAALRPARYEALANAWGFTAQVLIWVGLVPFAIIGLVEAFIDDPTVIVAVLVIILALPLIQLLLTLYRTARLEP